VLFVRSFDMRAADMAASRLINFQARAMHDMAYVMRHRMPKLLVVAVAAQLPKIFVSVASVTMNGVVIIPGHQATASLSSM